LVSNFFLTLIVEYLLLVVTWLYDSDCLDDT